MYVSQTIYTEFSDLVKVLDSYSKYAIGNKLSLADVSIYCLVTQFYEGVANDAAKNTASNIAKLRDIVIRVASRPEVRVYLSDRVQTLF